MNRYRVTLTDDSSFTVAADRYRPEGTMVVFEIRTDDPGRGRSGWQAVSTLRQTDIRHIEQATPTHQ